MPDYVKPEQIQEIIGLFESAITNHDKGLFSPHTYNEEHTAIHAKIILGTLRGIKEGKITHGDPSFLDSLRAFHEHAQHTYPITATDNIVIATRALAEYGILDSQKLPVRTPAVTPRNTEETRKLLADLEKLLHIGENPVYTHITALRKSFDVNVLHGTLQGICNGTASHGGPHLRGALFSMGDILKEHKDELPMVYELAERAAAEGIFSSRMGGIRKTAQVA